MIALVVVAMMAVMMIDLRESVSRTDTLARNALRRSCGSPGAFNKSCVHNINILLLKLTCGNNHDDAYGEGDYSEGVCRCEWVSESETQRERERESHSWISSAVCCLVQCRLVLWVLTRTLSLLA